LDWYQLNWQPHIGDPHFMGWFTVFAYVCCGLLSFVLFRNTPQYFSDHIGRQRSFWGLMCVAMALLAINKQLDLQSLLTEIGRLLSKEQGWYNNRRVVQQAFIMGVAIAAVAIVSALAFYYRQIVKANAIALVGTGFVVSFVVIRAASFHHVDHLLGKSIAGFRLNWLFELTGLTLIAANALLLKRKPQVPMMNQQ